MVEKHSDLIVDLVSKNVAHQQICRTLSMCLLFEEENDAELEEIQPEFNNDRFELEMPQPVIQEYPKYEHNCYICLRAMRILNKIVRRGNKDEIKEALGHVCQKLRKDHQGCEEMVKNHSEQIIELVSNHTRVGLICVTIGMCHKRASQENFDIDETLSKELDNEVEVEFRLSLNVDFEGAPKCSICKEAMKALKSMIHHGGKDEIKRALSHVCHRVGKLHHVCEEMVNKHSDQIVDLITKHTPPYLICYKIGMCHKRASEEDFEIEETLLEEQDNQLAVDMLLTSSVKCSLCKRILKALEKKIKKFDDRSGIQRALEKICSKLGGALSKKCDKMVKKHGNHIIDLLVNGVANKKICSSIGFCKKPKFLEYFAIDEMAPEEEFSDLKAVCSFWKEFTSGKIADQLEGPTDPEGGPFCLICELMVARIKEIVDTKAKRNNIVRGFMNVCDHLPNFIGEPCHYIVHGYFPGALDLISKVSPHEVCHFLTDSDGLGILQEFDETFNEFLDTNCALST
ncbi:prosaposin-like isoform X2 [Drosophila innubila]|uniref:prosaposin-like isoform X2 n=1 Tax=Drosophila innubila TaxID=198719 RepID=UPI00148D7B59|nr:prosaposin-like isoform X2 [Drosophila innubila]